MKLVHVIPNFHNPAGCTLSAAKRERLVELAAEHGFWIFEDDPYRELPFEDEPPPTMLSLDESDRVIHSSSFSKTVSPGVRVGYLAGPEEEIDKLAKRANELYISPNMLAESIVWELCRSGALDENIAFVKGALRERRDALVDALREQLPEAEFVVPGRRLLPVADAGRRRRLARSSWPPRSRRGWRSSPDPTSCSRAGAPACGSRSPACPPSRSARASRASPARSSGCAPRARPDAPGDARPRSLVYAGELFTPPLHAA